VSIAEIDAIGFGFSEITLESSVRSPNTLTYPIKIKVYQSSHHQELFVIKMSLSSIKSTGLKLIMPDGTKLGTIHNSISGWQPLSLYWGHVMPLL